MAHDHAEILSQGDEVVTGEVADTNAAELSQALEGWGWRVVRHVAVGDDPAAIAEAVAAAAARAALVVCTGGLGPTEDDHTAEAVARAFNLPLAEHPEALAQVAARYLGFGREVDEPGRRQARIPAGATVLENRGGTAPGFRLRQGACDLWFLPGVPREMRRMVADHLALALAGVHPEPRRARFRCAGLPESRAQALLQGLHHPRIAVGYRAVIPEVQVKLRAPADLPEAEWAAFRDEVRARLGSRVFSEGDASLEAVVGRLLLARGETVATAESCTAGRVAAALTRVPGSSAWFMEGLVVYANAAKERLAGVDPALLAAHGAVSEPVARALAEGVRSRAGTAWGLSTTGVAGPGGGTEEKPVGTVYVAVAGPAGTVARRLQGPGDREQVMERAVGAVLDLLRREVGGAR